METNFFTAIYDLTQKADLHLVIARGTDNQLVVIVRPTNENCQDEASKLIEPLKLAATVEELNQHFFTTITQPVLKVADLFSNMQTFVDSVETARKNSKMEQEKKDKEKKDKDEREKKYKSKMEKVVELEKQEKWGEAIGAMPKAEEHPEREKEITEKLTGLKARHSVITMF